MNVPNKSQPHASIALTATASTLSALGYVIHEKTATVIIQSGGGDTRMTINGTNPTALSGIKIEDGEMIQIGLEEAIVAKFIIGSGTPKLEIAAYLK
jgi:hypothetical protein